MEIGKIKKLHDMPDLVARNAGTHTDYYEIPKKEYERITAIDDYKAKMNAEYKAKMPDWIRWGYGFYGVNVCEMDGKYYYTVCTGNSCE